MNKIFTLILTLAALHVQSQPCIPNTNSIVLDGFSSYASVSPQTGLDITTSITIEGWINPSSFGFNSAQNTIVCKHGWSAGEGGFVLRCGGTGELSFNIAGIDTFQQPVSWVEVFSPVNVLSLNTWAHVAGTYDGQELKCYVNGNLVATTPFIGSIAPSPSYPLALGRLADPVWGPDRYFSGSIDEVRIWNRALTQTEIMSFMDDHIDPAAVTGLVSYWRMNEGANSTLYDIAGTNNGGLVFCTWDTLVPFNAVPDVPVITYNNGTLYSSAPIGNQWFVDGNLIGGATQNTFTPAQNGIYTVEVTSPQGCSASSAAFTVIDVQIAEQQFDVQLLLYPNPVSDKAILEITSQDDAGSVSLIITDMQGRTAKAIHNIKITFPLTSVAVDANQMESGMYFYSLQTKGTSIGKGKMLVQ